jgi:hypothetical protein
LTTTAQAPATIPAPAATTAPAPGRKLLKGGAEITESVLKRKPNREDVRWFYGQVPNLAGVVWQLAEDGIYYAYEDELIAHFEMKAAEAKANALAAAEAKAAEKEAVTEAARKAAQSVPIKSRKPPAPKAMAAHKAPAPHKPTKAKSVAAE